MPRLTVPPNFIGTSGIDTLVAQESNTSLAIGIDILNPGVRGINHLFDSAITAKYLFLLRI
ncbi:hypothetical protein COO91_01550 [Nostoc flagelliforme CCNUN1]|uniref:Uncharacterized protein n=1 Tax=Nostoc flagelliforme CCNUN1 TaxID=2038116 RepID=A0A2K8SJY3_9NOSO|nr:hypothetical protein [Nostoc flagelliforme]AUB35660.1 hypothetical protein COO91_01550 [Nostoc flagelliforme CCNUN1]